MFQDVCVLLLLSSFSLFFIFLLLFFLYSSLILSYFPFLFPFFLRLSSLLFSFSLPIPVLKTAWKGHATHPPGGDGSIPVGAECFGEEPTHPRSFSPEEGFVVCVCVCVFFTSSKHSSLVFPPRHYGLWVNKHKDIQATLGGKKPSTISNLLIQSWLCGAKCRVIYPITEFPS